MNEKNGLWIPIKIRPSTKCKLCKMCGSNRIENFDTIINELIDYYEASNNSSSHKTQLRW